MVSRSHTAVALLTLVVLVLAACGEPEPAENGTPVAVVTADATRTAAAVASPPAPPPAQPTPTASPTASPAPVAVATVARPSEASTPVPTPTETSKLAVAPTPTRTPQPTRTPTPTRPAEEAEPKLPTNGGPVADKVSLTEADEALSTVEVVKILRPSVVHIATRVVAMGMFEQPVLRGGVGTGIILDEKGHILTNNHVIEDAQDIIVTLSNDESFRAQIVGRDAITDTAIIRIEAEGLTPAKLGDSSKVEVGEDVIAIGHALGLPGGPTVSKGVVSALDRALLADPEERIVIVDLIQTDASINPGNSGGPLVNTRAEVIGINTAIIPQSQGIGFAISIDGAKVVAAQMIETGSVTRGFLGIRPIAVTPPIASQFGFPVNAGVFVEIVFPDTAAERAGLRQGDIIVRLGEVEITNAGELSKFLTAHPPGETIDVVFFRGSERTTVQNVTLGERPPE